MHRAGTAQPRPLPVGSTVTGASARRWGAVLAVLVAGLAGCSDGGSGPAPSAGGPLPTAAAADVGLTATLVAHRDDVLRRIVSVQLRAAVPVEVLQVRLVTPAFRAAAPGTAVPGTRASLLPGSPVDLRVPYGPADCTDRTDRAATAVVQVALGGGQSEVRLPVASAPEVLGRLQRAECAELDARRQVELSLDGFAGQQTPPGQEVITGTLRVRRLAGTTAVRITEISRSTLLAPAAGPAGGPVLVLEPAAQQAQVPVEVRPARCDSHALAESKRSTVFRVFVALGDDPPVLVLVEPPDADRAALVAHVTAVCAAKGG